MRNFLSGASFLDFSGAAEMPARPLRTGSGAGGLCSHEFRTEPEGEHRYRFAVTIAPGSVKRNKFIMAGHRAGQSRSARAGTG
jgi:hypothetical protein